MPLLTVSQDSWRFAPPSIFEQVGALGEFWGHVVQARRAAWPARVIIPLAVAAALLVGSLAAWKFWPNETTAGPQAASSTTAAESQAPSIAELSPTPRPLLIPPARPPVLEACQAKYRPRTRC